MRDIVPISLTSLRPKFPKVRRTYHQRKKMPYPLDIKTFPKLRHTTLDIQIPLLILLPIPLRDAQSQILLYGHLHYQFLYHYRKSIQLFDVEYGP